MKPATLAERQLKNARKWLAQYATAERQTTGAERAKYRQACDNMKRWIAVIERERKTP